MIAVIFEVTPCDGKVENYLRIAAELGEKLKTMDGFISVERFQSLTEPTKLLSLSFWRDEQAIEAWRNVELHRKAQQAGRESIFSYYRLRIGEIKRDYGKINREQAPTTPEAQINSYFSPNASPHIPHLLTTDE